MNLTSEVIADVTAKQMSRPTHGVLSRVDSALLAAIITAVIMAIIECLKARDWTAEEAVRRAARPWFWQRWTIRAMVREEAARRRIRHDEDGFEVELWAPVIPGVDCDGLADDLLAVAGGMSPADVDALAREYGRELRRHEPEEW